MIDSEFLWKKAYNQLMTRAWFELLYPILGHPNMGNIFRFLEERSSKNIRITPKDANLFSPYNLFEPEDTKVVMLGVRPNCHFPEHNNGLAYSRKKTQHGPKFLHADTLITCIESCEKQHLGSGDYYKKYVDLNKYDRELNRLIAEQEELPVGDVDAVKELSNEYFKISSKVEEEKCLLDIGWYNELHRYNYPIDILASQGILAINAVPTVEESDMSSFKKHMDVWKWYTTNLLTLLSDELENVVFLAWEQRPRELLNSFIDTQKHLILDPIGLEEYNLTEKINDYIKEHRSVKKIIDFNLFIENV